MSDRRRQPQTGRGTQARGAGSRTTKAVSKGGGSGRRPPSSSGYSSSSSSARRPRNTAPQSKRRTVSQKKSPSRSRKMLRDWGEAFVVAAFFVLVMYLVFWPVRYDGLAMEPAIRSGDRIFISRAAAWLNMLNHGDIVLYRHVYTDALGTERRVDSVARIIGVPLDRVSISGGTVFLNGRPLDEPYLQEGITTHPEMEAVTLGRLQFFVMVDNRFVGGDSRDFGVVERGNISARAVLRFNRLQ